MIGIYEYLIWVITLILGMSLGYLFAWYQIWYDKYVKTVKAVRGEE